MDRLIITMPIAPYKTFSVGKLTTPILAETLAKKMNAKFILAVNLLDSYKERSIDEYKKLLKYYQINPDEYWIDKDNIENLLDKIYELINKQYIYEKEEKILSCPCKKVEIAKTNLSTINMIDANFIKKDNEYYCKYCHNKCHIKSNKVLVFNPNLIKDKQYNFYPEFINKDIKTFLETVGKNEIIISRTRETGISLSYKDNIYNLDIDFLWQVYISLFPNSEKIILCSNHQLYQLFMVAMLEKCFDNKGRTICLATPYLNILDKTKESELKERIISLKIFTLLNQKWTRKENNFDEGLLKYINSMNIQKKEELYNLIREKSTEEDFDEVLRIILTKEINRQNLTKQLKIRRKKNV